jgi:hypothetical protein
MLHPYSRFVEVATVPRVTHLRARASGGRRRGAARVQRTPTAAVTGPQVRYHFASRSEPVSGRPLGDRCLSPPARERRGRILS